MSEDLGSRGPLERLRKEAKRWLKNVRDGDPRAVSRLLQALPEAPSLPGLRDVQHALARERGYDGWRSLKSSLSARSTTVPGSREEALAALLRAAEEGDVDRVRGILDRHSDIIDERGELSGHSGMRTALHFAVDGPHEPVIRLLLERGADPNIRDQGDRAFPLHFVAEQGRLDLVRLLIEHGADPIGSGDHHELEVLGWATAFEYVEPAQELVDYLLEHGARHNIFSAVATGDVAAVREIVAASPSELERRMDLTNHHRRPLHLAVVKRQKEVLKTLLELGADPGTVDESGLTSLDQAVLSGQLALGQFLVERGAEVTLPAAVVLERDDDIERLLADDPDALRPGHRWGTLIIRAAEYANGRVVANLIRLGASVDVLDDTKTSVDSTARYTPLHGAAWNGNSGTVRVLLENGANPRVRDEKYCATPAGWAAYAGHHETRDLILAGPIDLFDVIRFDARDRIVDVLDRDPEALNRPFGEYASCESDRSWCSPLAAAVIGDRAEVARILIERGADTTIESPEGLTLWDLATESGKSDVARVLERSRLNTGNEGTVATGELEPQ